MFSDEQQPGQDRLLRAQAASNPNLYATLAISEMEARVGGNRVLTLPDGKQISVSIPPGAQNGQVIELSDPGAKIGEVPSVLHLTLSVQQGHTTPFSEDNDFTIASADASTFVKPSPPNVAPGNNPTWQAGTATNPGVGSRTSPGSPPSFPGAVNPAYSGQANPASPGSPPSFPGAVNPAYFGQANPASPGSPPSFPGAVNPAYFGQANPASPSFSPPSPDSTTQAYSGSAPPSYPSGPPPNFLTQAYSGSTPSSYPSGPPPNFSTQAPPQRPPERERRSSGNVLLISLVVALLLILGGAGLLYALHGFGSATNGSSSPTVSSQGNNNATSTALANLGSTATVQAQASATANAQSTATARSTPTSGITPTPTSTNPYGGTLVLNDPLVDNSQGHQWYTSSSCQFTNSAYHMVMPGNYGGPCFGAATHYVNFAFQVQMTFFKYGQHFSGGGLVFRGSSGSKYYVLEIFESAQYTFYSCNGNDCSHGIAGYPASSSIPSFHTGLNQTNTIAVVANGNTFSFYANGQSFAGPITDSTYTQGTIGFFAEGGSEGGAGATTDVAYSNAKVWQL
jgi:hypothetical protein